jgi:hypothetical protein
MEAWMTQGHDPGNVVAADTEARWGAGGLLSNARDMLLFLRANLQPMGSPLGEAMMLARKPRRPSGQTGNDIGLAWQTFRAGERSVVWHGGRRAGFMAQVGFDPERHLAAVVLTNTEAFTDSDLTTALLLMAPPPEAWEARSDPATLPTYVGEYRRSSGGSFYIRLEDEGWLTYQPTGKARTRLYPRSDRTFYMLRGPWSVTFHEDRGGEVTGMTMTVDEREPAQQGMERSLRRVSADVPPPDLVATGFMSSVSFPWALALKIAGVGVALLVVAGLATRFRKS